MFRGIRARDFGLEGCRVIASRRRRLELSVF